MPPPTALHDRVELQRTEMTPDGAGGHQRVHVPRATLWAKVTALGARQVYVDDGRAVAITHTVVIRHRTGVRPGDRFLYQERPLEVVSAEDISGRRRFLACRCRETAVQG
ncbi:MAG TPA: phage head closure protein [Devosiaceae bacterium]|jgi:SPP1 family predicted phage head-tail adaptor|nr:phage head closure protein [Devosiaceae bacterium]